MQIGIRAHDVKASTFEGLVQEIHREGFACCQLAVSKAVKDIPTNKEVLTPGLAHYMRRIFDRNEVDVAVLGCYLNLANPNPEKLADILDTYKRHIRFAAQIGAGVVGTETGACNEAYQYEPFSHSDEALDIFTQNLKIVVDYAERMGVIVGIEPVFKHIVCNAERTRKVLDTINSPNLQIIFDPVNLIHETNYENCDAIIREFVEMNGKEIAVFHSKDFVVEDGRMKTVPSGQGRLDYDFLLKYMKEHKPFIHTLLENTKPENAIQTKEFMETKYAGI